MRTIKGGVFLSLDGIIQAPGGPSEDPTGGFQHGGWVAGMFDEGGAATGRFAEQGCEVILSVRCGGGIGTAAGERGERGAAVVRFSGRGQGGLLGACEAIGERGPGTGTRSKTAEVFVDHSVPFQGPLGQTRTRRRL